MLPLWAPDSRRIGFFANGKLNTVDVESAAVRILCEAPIGRCGGTWSRDGGIVFAPSLTGPLYRIPESVADFGDLIEFFATLFRRHVLECA